MQGAEERRLRRMEQYAARPPARRAYAPEGGAIEGNAADDALMVDQGLEKRLKKLVELCILKSLLSKWSDGVLE